MTTFLAQAESLRLRTEKILRKRFDGYVNLQPAYDKLLLQYAETVLLMQIPDEVNDKITRLQDMIAKSQKRLEAYDSVAWTPAWNVHLEEQFQEELFRFTRYDDQLWALEWTKQTPRIVQQEVQKALL